MGNLLGNWLTSSKEGDRRLLAIWLFLFLKIELGVVLVHTNRHEAFVKVPRELIIFLYLISWKRFILDKERALRSRTLAELNMTWQDLLELLAAHPLVWGRNYCFSRTTLRRVPIDSFEVALASFLKASNCIAHNSLYFMQYIVFAALSYNARFSEEATSIYLLYFSSLPYSGVDNMSYHRFLVNFSFLFGDNH